MKFSQGKGIITCVIWSWNHGDMCRITINDIRYRKKYDSACLNSMDVLLDEMYYIKSELMKEPDVTDVYFELINLDEK